MKKRGKRRPNRRTEPSSVRSLQPWILFGVAGATFIGFASSLNHGFVDWDDVENFVTNPHYRGLGWAQLKWMWTTVLLGHYIPISWMTLGVDYLAWGMNPTGYHLTNVLFHSANAAVFYLVAQRLIQRSMLDAATAYPLAWRLSAALAALLFAVHPLRVESVAWVTERRDVLSGFCYLLAVWAYLRDAEVADRRAPSPAAVVLGVARLFRAGLVVQGDHRDAPDGPRRAGHLSAPAHRS